jgi:ribosomal protein L24E
MVKCTYCNKKYEWPKGTTVVNSGTSNVLYFCSSKCRSYFEMKRKKKKWALPKKEK